MSCLSAEDVTRLLAPELEDFTDSTPRNEADLIGAIQSARQLGFAKMSGTFERDVVGLASPVLDYNGGVVGAVAVAMPVARFGEDIERNAASACKTGRCANFAPIWRYACRYGLTGPRPRKDNARKTTIDTKHNRPYCVILRVR